MIDKIVVGVDIFKVVVGCVLDVIIVFVIEFLKEGDDVVLVGFGIFVVKECVVCIGCNL